ncbi:Protein Star [Orchesella cincta]|uniref:Protein Star n=1 Tax=Orchesella cincta TaxID=48709 RepID=A0A1D2MT65_ORCCI|nr:Protein Star [Orchesella cincta]
MVRQIFKIRHITITLLSIPLFLVFIKRNFRAGISSTSNNHDYNDFDLEFVENNLMELDQGDPQLVKYSRIKYLSPPSKLPYQLNGIHATTINHTDVFSELIAKWFQNKSNFFNDYNYTQTGRLETSLNKVKSNSSILYEVYSIPLYTLVAALGYKEIDFFALDVEGAEMEILLTIPFDLLTIKVLTVEEFYHRQRNMLGKMDKFLRENGMHYVGLLEKDRV